MSQNEDEYLFSLPFPPSINSYYGHTCIGKAIRQAVAKIYIKDKGREYRKDVIEIIKNKKLDIKANVPLEVTITLTPPDNRVHDIDNVLKGLFDSLTHAEFWEDDKWVRKLTMDYREDIKYTKPGSVLIYVKALEIK